MKNTLIFLSLLLLFSCKKEDTRDQPVKWWNQLYTYNSDGSLQKTTWKFISYFEGDSPENYVDRSFHFTEFLYSAGTAHTGEQNG